MGTLIVKLKFKAVRALGTPFRNELSKKKIKRREGYRSRFLVSEQRQILA